ncbi:hypothetical protein [Collimonas silvisoli]|uniref:hypothetical protein n=1 Tax=Collimonas silvisoli TaxID=2825884 RepID=UPI001B8BFDE9|nr:hypothetical protein [Collimonas silvisoli]
MSLYHHSKNCELVIGIVAPVGVNLDDVENRLGSLFHQFQYEFNFIHVSKLCLSYLDVPATTKTELERLDSGMNNGKDLRGKYKRGDFYALLAINAINVKRTTEDGEPGLMPFS